MLWGRRLAQKQNFRHQSRVADSRGALRLFNGSEDRTASDFRAASGIARPGAKAKKAAPESGAAKENFELPRM
jgi:hypothetical protein